MERVLEKNDQMYEKVTLYDFSDFGGGGSFKWSAIIQKDYTLLPMTL